MIGRCRGLRRTARLVVVALVAGCALVASSWVGAVGAAEATAGYWFVAADGGVFNFGTAGFFGSAGGSPVGAPVVGMATTPSGEGYWLVSGAGVVLNYGDAAWFGSIGAHLNAPIVGMAASPADDG